MRSVIEARIGDRITRLVQTEPKGEGEIASSRLGFLFRNLPQAGGERVDVAIAIVDLQKIQQQPEPLDLSCRCPHDGKTLRLVVEPVAGNLGMLRPSACRVIEMMTSRRLGS